MTQAVCDLALRFGESTEDDEAMMVSDLKHPQCFGHADSSLFSCLISQSRPFGVALLLAGIDVKGPQLFHADPSGTMVRYDAKAIGSGSEGAQAELQDKYNKVSHERNGEFLTYELTRRTRSTTA